MKVVLSRKGMDSRAGGIPSPILPDGTLLSLPIPNEKSGVPYGDLVYKGRTYQQIIQQIHPTFDFQKHPFCHLDPDIYGVFNCIGFSNVGFSCVGFSNVGFSNVGETDAGTGCGNSKIT